MSHFAIGDCAVYYGRGVGVVIGQEGEDPRGNPCEIFVLQLEKSLARVRADDPTTSTIRPVMTKELLEQVYETLADRSTKPSQTTWNRRYREYVQKIQSGAPLEVASVLRDLELLSIRKSLSFGESKIYSQARNLVIEEGAYVEIENTLVDLQKKFHTLSKKVSKPEEFLTEVFSSFFVLYRDEYNIFAEKIRKIQKELSNKDKEIDEENAADFARVLKDLENMKLTKHLPINNKKSLITKLTELENTLFNIQLFTTRHLVTTSVQAKKRRLIANLEFLIENLETSQKDIPIKQAIILYHSIVKTGIRNENAEINLNSLVDLFRLKSVQTKEKVDAKIKSLFQKERDVVRSEREEQERKKGKRSSKSKKTAAPKLTEVKKEETTEVKKEETAEVKNEGSQT